MERRDLILDEIERLGKVLRKIIGDFFKLKTSNEKQQSVKFVSERLASDLDTNLNGILDLDKTELEILFKKKNYSEKEFDLFAIFFEEMGVISETEEKENGKIFLKKALLFFELADENSKTLSIFRQNKMVELRRKIKM